VTEIVSNQGMRQVKLAESLEMPEFIYYYNGKSERLFFNEDRITVPSPDMPSFTSVPEMSSYLLTDKCIEIIKKGLKDYILVNYINFGVMQKLGAVDNQVKALEIVDQCLGLLYQSLNKKEDTMIITAQYPAQVPFIIIQNKKIKLKKIGELKDAPVTVLKLLGIDKPDSMTGKTLILK
jgi:2,3-bisphosphoglycerate-independent phosphoglycerate mutase